MLILTSLVVAYTLSYEVIAANPTAHKLIMFTLCLFAIFNVMYRYRRILF